MALQIISGLFYIEFLGFHLPKYGAYIKVGYRLPPGQHLLNLVINFRLERVKLRFRGCVKYA